MTTTSKPMLDTYPARINLDSTALAATRACEQACRDLLAGMS